MHPYESSNPQSVGIHTLAELQALLGATAHWTAAVRARESEREDCLFSDPYAAAMAGDVGATWMAQRPPESTLPIALRTRYFDDFLRQATAQEGIRQIVLVGAGLDSRAFRLEWPPATTLYEIEQAAILAYKQEVLRAAGGVPRTTRVAIAADLTQPWSEKLLQAGFQPEERSLWLLEGFLFYLPNERIDDLLEAVTGLAAAGSWLGFDIINSAVLTSPFTKPWVDMQAEQGAPWIGTMDDPLSYLAARGWTAALTQAGAPDAHYGRWTLPVVPTTLAGFPHNWYVTAVRQKPPQALPGQMDGGGQ